jgi:hypothetical protein
MTSLEINFTTLTTAAIVAGRALTGERTVEDWERLCAGFDELARTLNMPQRALRLRGSCG